MLSKRELAGARLIAEALLFEERLILLVAGVSGDGRSRVVDCLLLIIVDRDPGPGVDFKVFALAAMLFQGGFDDGLLNLRCVVCGPKRMHHQPIADFDGKIGHLLLKGGDPDGNMVRSEEHTSELQSLMRISYAVFCLKKKK